jgi:hypothetical protein
MLGKASFESRLQLQSASPSRALISTCRGQPDRAIHSRPLKIHPHIHRTEKRKTSLNLSLGGRRPGACRRKARRGMDRLLPGLRRRRGRTARARERPGWTRWMRTRTRTQPELSRTDRTMGTREARMRSATGMVSTWSSRQSSKESSLADMKMGQSNIHQPWSMSARWSIHALT